MDGRGWSDIAYQVAVDQWGRAWILRGLTVQSAANGNEALNERYGALLLVLVKGERPTEAMLSTARGVIADFRDHYPNGRLIKGHGEIRPDGTDCPGAATRAAIDAGKLTPNTEPPEDDMQLSDRINLAGEEAGQIIGLDSISVDGAFGYAASTKFLVELLDAKVQAMGERIEQMHSGEVARDLAEGDRDQASRVRVEVLFRAVLDAQGVAGADVDALMVQVNAILEAVQPEEPAEPPA